MKKQVELDVGSVVMLKSGGPHMTVMAINRENEGGACVTCEWFNQNEQIQEHVFYIRQLGAVSIPAQVHTNENNNTTVSASY